MKGSASVGLGGGAHAPSVSETRWHPYMLIHYLYKVGWMVLSCLVEGMVAMVSIFATYVSRVQVV